MPTRTHVFPDTNYFLHWPKFDETNWNEMMGADQVEILVASVVLYEIERHKDKHSREGVRARARYVASKLEGMEAERPCGALLSDRVSVRVLFDAAPPEDIASDTLAKGVVDDWIIAAMQRQRDLRPNDRFVVLTGDRTLRMKARHYNFEAMEPSAATRVRDDAEESEIERLRKELDKERSRRPKPCIEHVDSGDPLNWLRFVPTCSVEAFLADRLAAIRESYPKIPTDRSPLLSAFGQPVEEISRYNERVDGYYGSVTTYLRRNFNLSVEAYRMPVLRLRAINNGTAPASDVRIALALEPGLVFWRLDEIPQEEAPPRKPPPRPDRIVAPAIGFDRDEFKWRPLEPSATGFRLAADRNSAWIETPSLVHNAPVELPLLAVGTLDGRAAGSFPFSCRITCAELAEPLDKPLNVVAKDGTDMELEDHFQRWLRKRFKTQLELINEASPELWQD